MKHSWEILSASIVSEKKYNVKKAILAFDVTVSVNGILFSHQYSVFTRRHGRILVSLNKGTTAMHVGAPKWALAYWTLFLCKRVLLFWLVKLLMDNASEIKYDLVVLKPNLKKNKNKKKIKNNTCHAKYNIQLDLRWHTPSCRPVSFRIHEWS